MVYLRKTPEPQKSIKTAVLLTFYTFLRTINIFLLLTNTNYAKMTFLSDSLYEKLGQPLWNDIKLFVLIFLIVFNQ